MLNFSLLQHKCKPIGDIFQTIRIIAPLFKGFLTLQALKKQIISDIEVK